MCRSSFRKSHKLLSNRPTLPTAQGFMSIEDACSPRLTPAAELLFGHVQTLPRRGHTEPNEVHGGLVASFKPQAACQLQKKLGGRDDFAIAFGDYRVTKFAQSFHYSVCRHGQFRSSWKGIRMLDVRRRIHPSWKHSATLMTWKQGPFPQPPAERT